MAKANDTGQQWIEIQEKTLSFYPVFHTIKNPHWGFDGRYRSCSLTHLDFLWQQGQVVKGPPVGKCTHDWHRARLLDTLGVSSENSNNAVGLIIIARNVAQTLFVVGNNCRAGNKVTSIGQLKSPFSYMHGKNHISQNFP